MKNNVSSGTFLPHPCQVSPSQEPGPFDRWRWVTVVAGPVDVTPTSQYQDIRHEVAECRATPSVFPFYYTPVEIPSPVDCVLPIQKSRLRLPRNRRGLPPPFPSCRRPRHIDFGCLCRPSRRLAHRRRSPRAEVPRPRTSPDLVRPPRADLPPADRLPPFGKEGGGVRGLLSERL